MGWGLSSKSTTFQASWRQLKQATFDSDDEDEEQCSSKSKDVKRLSVTEAQDDEKDEKDAKKSLLLSDFLDLEVPFCIFLLF